jgi:hypothetical protein
MRYFRFYHWFLILKFDFARNLEIFFKVFAGRDASRALATFSVEETLFKDEHDDLSDLTSSQMASVKEWEMQFLGLTSFFVLYDRILYFKGLKAHGCC